MLTTGLQHVGISGTLQPDLQKLSPSATPTDTRPQKNKKQKPRRLRVAGQTHTVRAAPSLVQQLRLLDIPAWTRDSFSMWRSSEESITHARKILLPLFSRSASSRFIAMVKLACVEEDEEEEAEEEE